MQKFKTGKKAVKSLSAVAVALAMGTSVFAGTVFASAAGDDAATASSLTKYYTDYNSMEDAKKAAEDLTRQIVGEGASLLKNSNEALPMSGSEWVSVFGVTSDNLVGASDSAGAFSSGSTSSDETLAAALEHAGFKVNPTLKSFYANDTSSIGAEVTDFPGTVDSSTKLYNDAAFIVLSRKGGEGSDASRVTDQTVDEDDDHLALYTDDEGNTYKHYLMLTDEEEALIEYVTSRFDKVIVITNTSNAMELEDLENNDKISAILHIGRPGVGGLAGVTDILTGLSPSGSLVDEWMTDFTTDPTWYNFGSNNQTGDATVGNGAGSNAYRRESGALVGSSQDRVIKGYETAADGVEVTPDGQDPSKGTDKDGNKYVKEGEVWYKLDQNGEKIPVYGGNTYTSYDGEGYHGVDYEEGIYLGYKYYETVYTEIVNGNLSYDAETKVLTENSVSAGKSDESVEAAEKWWEENIAGTRDYSGDERAAAEAAADGRYFQPYLSGERSPHNDVNARGAFIGLSSTTTRADMSRAVMEGVAFALRECIEVAGANGVRPAKATVCGGGAKSALWRRILADVLNLPVTVCANVQGPAYGGAILAMTGCGEYASVRSACKSVVKYGETCAPNPARAAAYEKKYGVFKRLYPARKDISL